MGQDLKADASEHIRLRETFKGQLARAQRVLSTGVWLETLSFAALGIMAAFVVALAIVILSANPKLRYLAISLGALIAGASIFFASRRAKKLLSSKENTATRLEEAARQRGLEMGDRVRSAAGLLDTSDDKQKGPSRLLSNAHIAKVAKDLESSKALFIFVISILLLF